MITFAFSNVKCIFDMQERRHIKEKSEMYKEKNIKRDKQRRNTW